ncbi:Inositol 2-dehydrogenase [Anatilimnocola aggregata]|uniref:Inositol 2-dehydrogenase n=1 Tax=Anatilimnocola aggregata TaxID=2528021 RepID=A0A517YFX0_9BACT|nr:Gfo/Idh/MocA family oxidoreductase [Anatilimnocola aggregata]QDU29137.1 Inositol 2-dehydrogenase [Anatilimnocola aggregata]
MSRRMLANSSAVSRLTLSRRTFVQGTAAATASLLLGPPAFLRGQNLNSKLNLAIIGCGGRGGANLSSVKHENIVGLCDVAASTVDRVGQQFSGAAKFTDYRRIYERAKEFDAVVVSTCEHTHAFATLPALQLGKHVYCEKPLTHSIWEARVIREAAAKAKVATQMGTQIHAGDNYRRVVELIQTGAIGPVREAHVWVSRAWGRQSAEDAKTHKDIVSVMERPAGSSPIPAGLDWDLWLGPAPERPFHEVYYPGPKWYRWWDFGSGTMSDLGSHWNDLPFWALKLKTPRAIEASGPPPHVELAPASMQATYEYDAREDMPAVKLTWYQGVNKPTIWTEKGIPQWASGVLFIGDKGMLLSDYGKYVLLPESNFKDFKPPEPFIPKSVGHHEEWLQACRTGSPTTCNFEYAGLLTEANHLGNVAYRTGKRIEWDSVNLKATGCPEADPIIRREYRAPWKLI